MTPKKPDFSGFATIEGVRSRDGRPIALYERVQKLIARITYKPKYVITCSPRETGVEIRIRAAVPEANGRGYIPPSGWHEDVYSAFYDGRRLYNPVIEGLSEGECFIDFWRVIEYAELDRFDDAFVVEIIMHYVEELEIHELREFFRLDGKCVVDPHPELTRLKEAAALMKPKNEKLARKAAILLPMPEEAPK